MAKDRAIEVVKRWVRAMTAHDLEAAVSCFAHDYHDVKPATPGQEFRGRDRVRTNFTALFESIPDLRAEILRIVADGDTVWLEWRMHGTRDDDSPFEFAGVNIFGIEKDAIAWGRIYTELVRDEGDVNDQIERMTGSRAGTAQPSE